MKDNKTLILILAIISIVVIMAIIVILKNKTGNYNLTANIEEISINEKIKEHEEKIIQLDKEIKNLRTQYAEKSYLLTDDEIASYENEAKEINTQCKKLEEEKEEEQKALEKLYEASNITEE